MNKGFTIRNNGGCVDYAIGIARMALGYNPALPFTPQDGGPHTFGIVGMVGSWFPNHKIRVWCDEDDSRAPMRKNVEYMGPYFKNIADAFGENHIFLYVYDSHMVIGFPVGQVGLIIAVDITIP